MVLYTACRKSIVESEKGMTLIEIMVAIAIFSIGLMAISSMQVYSMMGTNSARETTEAVSVAENWSEYIRSLTFHDPTLDLDGNGVVEAYDMPPELALGNNKQAPADATPYTAWWSVTQGPLPDFPAGILDPVNTVPRSLNIRVWATPDGDPNDVMAEIYFARFRN